jgi:hypothetical protein
MRRMADRCRSAVPNYSQRRAHPAAHSNTIEGASAAILRLRAIRNVRRLKLNWHGIRIAA